MSLRGFPPWRVIHTQGDEAMSHANLSRRAIVVGTSTLPALAALPICAAVAAAAPSREIADASTTLPPDLIERFVRVRAWYLDNDKRHRLWRDAFNRRFYAASGVTMEQYRDMDYDHPPSQGRAAHSLEKALRGRTVF